MANSSLHNLNAASSMNATDELYLVISPFTTSDDRRISFSNFQNSITALGTLTGLTVSGSSSLALLVASGAVTLQSTLGVTGAASFTGDVVANHNLTVNNNLSANNQLLANGSLTVAGAAVFNGSVAMTSPAITTSITTPSTTFNLVNATATTVNFAGAATTMAIGASTALITVAGNIVETSNPIAASGNAATVPITHRISTVTNNSAATLTITLTTAGAVDAQLLMVRILDFSAVAQTITWVNTEDSTVAAPTTSNGSTTLPLTVGFQFNNGSGKWRCIASA